MGRPARAPLERVLPFVLDVPHPRHLPPDRVPKNLPRLDWDAVFGRPGPLEIEVGFGKVMFLTSAALAAPATRFLGIEIERKYAMLTADRLARQGLDNVRVACTDAKWLFQELVADACVDVLHVYFPDPWWKTKHKKRLLFTADFVREAARVLKPTGLFRFATDVREYFERSVALVAETRLLREVDAPPTPFATNFERKYVAEGRAIWRTAFARA